MEGIRNHIFALKFPNVTNIDKDHVWILKLCLSLLGRDGTDFSAGFGNKLFVTFGNGHFGSEYVFLDIELRKSAAHGEESKTPERLGYVNILRDLPKSEIGSAGV
jgi:hypothetical protein